MHRKRILLQIFVTIFAGNHLISSFKPIFAISVGNYILMELNQNYRPMNIYFCIEHNDVRCLQNMNLSAPPPGTKVSLTLWYDFDKN